MSRYRLVWAAVAAVAVAAIAGAVTGAVTSPPATTAFVLQTAQVRHGQPAFTGPSMTWRLTKTADPAVVKPGQRITYTIVVQQLQPPASVAERMCLGMPDQVDCVAANNALLSQPLVVDDLAAVSAHAEFDNDAKGAPGTVVRVSDRAGRTVVTAEPDTALASVSRLQFTFSVMVGRHARRGTWIRNTAYVSVHAEYAPAPGPLTNCPLGAVFTRADGVVPAACTALSAIPPAKGGAQTGFGGMAGHVGSLPGHVGSLPGHGRR
jgi:hypothetical protein